MNEKLTAVKVDGKTVGFRSPGTTTIGGKSWIVYNIDKVRVGTVYDTRDAAYLIKERS